MTSQEWMFDDVTVNDIVLNKTNGPPNSASCSYSSKSCQIILTKVCDSELYLPEGKKSKFGAQALQSVAELTTVSARRVAFY